MAVYSGSIKVKWVESWGSKVASLILMTITNYNQTGANLTGRQAGMDVIDTVLLGALPVDSGDSQTPISLSYDSTNHLLHFYKAAGQEVDSDINLFSLVGEIPLLVIGM